MLRDRSIKKICDEILYRVSELAGLAIKADIEDTNRKIEEQIEKMTEAEIEAKAEVYSDNLDLVKERNPKLKTNDDFIKQAFQDGAKWGAALAIEMRCCGNCKKRTLDCSENDICEISGERVFCGDKCSQWEM